MNKCTHAGPFDGCIRATVLQKDKHHLTGKPTALMEELVRPVTPGGTILDPFAGSGTTGVAAVLSGRRFIGVEREAAYVEIAHRRISQAAQSLTPPCPTVQPEIAEMEG
jgi:site-specific DNA-methyltransferase (adenine-specific)